VPPTAGSSTAEAGAAPHPPVPIDVAKPPSGVVLYLDVGHPESLLAAERALQVMPVATEWIPVHLGPPGPVDLDALAATAAARGLQPLKVSPAFPFDAEAAALAATFAKSTGRAVAFLQAALRQAYAGGRDLSVLDHVLIAGSACELHPRSVLKALETRGTRRTLEAATALARERGVTRAPSVVALGQVFEGDAGLDAAAAHLRAHGVAEEPAPEADVVSLLTVIPPPAR
jgi:2-hydroxychromene-2-carboxylate isomerase